MNLLLKLITFLLISFAAIVACLLAAIILVCTLLFDSQPTLTHFEKAQLDDIKRIKALAIEFQQNNSTSEVKTVTLAQRDINLGISHFGPSQVNIPDSTYVKVELKQDSGVIYATAPAFDLLTQVKQNNHYILNGLALSLFNHLHDYSQNKWVNIHLPITFITNESLKQTIDTGKISIGSLTLTKSLSDSVIGNIYSEATKRPETKMAMRTWDNIKHLEINQQKLTVKFVLPNNQNSALNSYQSIVLSSNEVELIDIYLQTLNSLPRQGSLTTVLAALFEQAKQRSKQTANPIAENKAALLALSKVYGGDQLLAMIQSSPLRALQNTPKPYKLYNRRDLAQHFILSAGLTLIADDSLAELIGIDKEMSDFMGGRTISAWDLLADKAGVRLAENATRTVNSAKRIQIALSHARRDKHILPDIGAEFAFSEDRFNASELEELTELIDLYLEQHPLLKK